MHLITKLYSLYSITTSITLALICHTFLNASRLLSRNREAMPLHKFFPRPAKCFILPKQSFVNWYFGAFPFPHENLRFHCILHASVFPFPHEKLRFHCILHASIQAGFTRRKLWAYWLSSTFLPLNREELVLVTLTCQLLLLPWKAAIFTRKVLVESIDVQKAGSQCRGLQFKECHVKRNKKERTTTGFKFSPFQTHYQ